MPHLSPFYHSPLISLYTAAVIMKKDGVYKKGTWTKLSNKDFDIPSRNFVFVKIFGNAVSYEL